MEGTEKTEGEEKLPPEIFAAVVSDEDVSKTIMADEQTERQEETAVDMPEQTQTTKNRKLDIMYGVNDVPPFYLCFILGFQHYLTMFGATIAIPLLLAPALCITDSVYTSELISTCFFVSGIVTVLQAVFGVRLPIVQGGTFSFLAPAFAILSLPQWQCPVDEGAGNSSDLNITNGSIVATTAGYEPDDPEIWQSRMREIQGAIILASLFQVVIGASGLIGFVLNYIGPMVIAPTIALVGLSLFQSASGFSSAMWWIAILTIILVILFSQYLRNVDLPCCGFTRGEGCRCTKYPVFKLFPVILAIVIAWGLCAILTVTNAFPDDENHWTYGARTDTKSEVLQQAKWFRFPYPGQWGAPTFSAASVFGMVAGVLAGMIESIGDYYACARLSGAPPPPIHAINRGILVEGIGCIIAGVFGTGTGTTSYSENIGAIGITKVASRRVIIYGGALMILLGMLGKFGALFVTIPDPIVGGVFTVMFGMITAVGISNLQFVDMNSSRNLFIFGFSLFFGLSLPQWMSQNTGAISTGNTSVDQILTVLLSTSMFVGGAVAFVLDNTVPGTLEERGMLLWNKELATENETEESKDEAMKTYDLPFGMSYIRRWNWTRFIPICPTFAGKFWGKSRNAVDINEDKSEAVIVQHNGKNGQTNGGDNSLCQRKNTANNNASETTSF